MIRFRRQLLAPTLYPVVAADGDLNAGQRRADRVRFSFFHAVHRYHGRGFGQPISLEKRHRECFFERASHVVGQRRRAAMQCAHRD